MTFYIFILTSTTRYNSEKYGGNQIDISDNVELYLLEDYLINLDLDSLSIEEKVLVYQLLGGDMSVFPLGNYTEFFIRRKGLEYIDNYISTHKNVYEVLSEIETNTVKQIIDIIKKYYPYATNKEIKNIANDFANSGCGFIAYANVFANFMGDMENGEQLFKEKFGYDLIIRDEEGNLSYNVETLAMDFFLFNYMQPPYRVIRPSGLHAIRYFHGEYSHGWFLVKSTSDYFKFFLNQYGIKTENDVVDVNSIDEIKNYIKENESSYLVLGAEYYDMIGLPYNLDCEWLEDETIVRNSYSTKNQYNFGAHAQVITNLDYDDNVIISSWSRKYKFIWTDKTRYVSITKFDFSLED